MKKIVYISVLLIIALISFWAGRVSVQVTSEIAIDKEADTSNIKGQENQALNTSKSSTGLIVVNKEPPKEKELKTTSQSEQKIPTNKNELDVYEDVLRSTVDTAQFEDSVNAVYQRFDNEPQTRKGENLQNQIKNKIFQEDLYNELLNKNIQFNDADCRLSLCKLDFNIVDTQNSSGNEGMDIAKALSSKFLNYENKAKIYSKLENGKISFYIGSGFLTE